MTRRIDRIISLSKEDEEEIFFDLGLALQYKYAPKGVRYKADYSRMGRELWTAIRYELYNIICNPKKKEPRLFVEELVSGDIRDLGTRIFTILVSQLSIPAAIAIPIVALVLKVGLQHYCSVAPIRPRRSYVAILASHKAAGNRHKKAAVIRSKPVHKAARK